jgi:serine/threonine protein kinase
MEYDENGNLIINSSFENALKEIAILKKMNHPNIIKLYEIMYCKKNKKIYLMLEHCEHGDLVNFDEEKNEFSLNKYIIENNFRKSNNKEYYSNKEILKFLEDIISGLYYLHTNGIIHRDIKPNNILLDKDNVCKITDFNVSTILDNIKDDNIGKSICSADHFRPPEACKTILESDDENEQNEEETDFRGKPIDIWALGVTAYILAYNKFPFESENNNIFELYEKIAKAEYEIPEEPHRCKTIKKL